MKLLVVSGQNCYIVFDWRLDLLFGSIKTYKNEPKKCFINRKNYKNVNYMVIYKNKKNWMFPLKNKNLISISIN